jgi:DNA repair protein RecN (Recombination protein N)
VFISFPCAMLSYLRVRNLAVLRDVEIEFGPGLNALTGETGAGKSILVDAVGLLMGQRADGQSIRHGEERCVVEGQFLAGDRVQSLLQEEGLAGEDGECVVRREVLLSAPNRVFINGHLGTLGQLRRLAAAQLTLHGQSRHLVLATAEAQRRFLDQVALPTTLQMELATSWQQLTEARQESAAHEQRMAEGARQLDILRFQLGEIEAVAPQPAEDDALRREERLLATCQERESLVQGLLQDLVDDDGATVPALARCLRRLESLASLDPSVQPLVERLSGASLEIEELAAEIRTAMPGEEMDPGRLESIQIRLQALQGLCRKYGGTLEQVTETADGLRKGIAEMTDGEETARRLHTRAVACATEFHEVALKVSRRRRSAARSLSRKVSAEIQTLNLAGARLQIQVESSPPAAGSDPDTVVLAGGRHGYDRVLFAFTAHPGDPLRDLAKVASGGELSRLMLALTLAMEESATGQAPRTFIFDEVDSGVGGDTAGAVGERLRRAAASNQVICVTHLPQVAALAAHHLVVTKTISKGRGGSCIAPLPHGERVGELARMLGGGVAAETARRHARGLLLAAAGEKDGGTAARRSKTPSKRSSQWA